MAARGERPEVIQRVMRHLLAMVAGEVVIYVFGLAGLSRFSLPNGLLEAGCCRS